MGLGKTLQTLLFLAWLIEQGALSDANRDREAEPWNPILIVAPVILLENEVWTRDMRQFFANDGAVFQPRFPGWKLLAAWRSGTGRETVIGEPALDLDASGRTASC